MTKQDYEYEFWFNENIKIKRLMHFVSVCKQYPEGVKFAIMGIIKTKEKEICIVRVDNYPHRGKQGTHIHKYKIKQVEFKSLSFNDAEELVIKIARDIQFKFFGG